MFSTVKSGMFSLKIAGNQRIERVLIMAGTDFIPASDEGFRTYANNFASNISADPGLYMLSVAQAASIQTAVDQFDAAFVTANNELTRTKPTITAQDNARSIAETMIRQYAAMIKPNTGITDDDKLAIGVRPINPNREPVECPQTSPLLSILGNTPGSQTLRFADTNSPDSRAKPHGASELQLFRAVGTVESAPLADAQFYGKFTKNPIPVEFDETDDGKMATYYARWASARGETGPWSLPISMRIAA